MESWNEYSFILMAAVLSLVLPLGLAAVSRLVRKKTHSPKEGHSQQQTLHAEITESIHGKRLNVRFFLGASLLLLFIGVFLLLIPAVLVLGAQTGWAAWGVVITASLCVLVLIYSARKGDLDWIRSFRTVAEVERDTAGDRDSDL